MTSGPFQLLRSPLMSFHFKDKDKYTQFNTWTKVKVL